LKTEKNLKQSIHFPSILSAPAKRALENNGISTLEQLSNYSKKEVLKFHGMGKSSIPKLEKLLSDQNMSFRLS
jgi:DNA-directed RNA polymerase alpha subunit